MQWGNPCQSKMETQQDKRQNPELCVRCLCTWRSQSFCDSAAQPGAGALCSDVSSSTPHCGGQQRHGHAYPPPADRLSHPQCGKGRKHSSRKPRGEWTPRHQCRQGRSLERQLLGKSLLRHPHPCVPAKAPLSSPTVLWA